MCVVLRGAWCRAPLRGMSWGCSVGGVSVAWCFFQGSFPAISLPLTWRCVAQLLASLTVCSPPHVVSVCFLCHSNALRNDLNHPNEYIRGCTLRFLCKLKEQDLLEPLVASIKVRC